MVAQSQPKVATPERIRALTVELEGHILGSSREIAEINLQTRLLSMNAQIEAARAGDAGRSFSVVGKEMVALSRRTSDAARRLETDSLNVVEELASISLQLSSVVRGTRLADLALTNIDLIDRNLYERSCDCRWWATDAAFVDALNSPSPETCGHAGRRMGVILKAYTVYFDIVLADRAGNIVANGRPQEFSSIGTNHATAPWFKSAWATASGDEFGFQTAHASGLANGQRVLVYSCKVTADGTAGGAPAGVLGIVFRWDALADHIVRSTPVDPADQTRTRACIVDNDGFILADSAGRALAERLDVPDRLKLFGERKTFTEAQVDGRPAFIAHALSPGFETYATGWHSVIIQHKG